MVFRLLVSLWRRILIQPSCLCLVFCFVVISGMSSFQNKQIDVSATITKAVELHKSGNIEDALLNYELALPYLTGNTKSSLHGNAGALYMQLGEFDKAKSHFQLSVDSNQNNAQAHFNLAVLLTSKLGQHAKAIKHCGTAIKLDPQNHKAQHLMGNIMQSIGRPNEAEKYFVLAESIALEKQEQTAPRTSTASGQLSKLNGWDKHQILSLQPGDSITYSLGSTEYTLNCLSITPYIFTVDNFISAVDCEHIRNKASLTLEKSFVMGGSSSDSSYTTSSTSDKQCENDVCADTNEIERNNNAYRSSYNAWLTPDTVLHTIQSKLAQLLGLPLTYIKQKSEDLQVVQYHGPTDGITSDIDAQHQHGGQFKVHHDSSAFHTRYLTALVYLNNITVANVNGDSDAQSTVYDGETWFPYANTADNAITNEYDHIMSVEQANAVALSHYDTVVSKAAKTNTESRQNIHDQLMGLKVAPREGSVVIFFNHHPETGELDPLAVHAGLPVRRHISANNTNSNLDNVVKVDTESLSTREGDKWIANYWIGLDRNMLSETAIA